MYNAVAFRHTLEQPRGSKSQAILHDRLKALLPDTVIETNYRLPFDSSQLGSNKLRFYEFDVSFKILKQDDDE
jgi:hypothetical protein